MSFFGKHRTPDHLSNPLFEGVPTVNIKHFLELNMNSTDIELVKSSGNCDAIVANLKAIAQSQGKSNLTHYITPAMVSAFAQTQS